MTTPALTTPVAAPTAPVTSSGTPVPRLRNGELRAMVARVLADHKGTGLTPRAIAHTLNRSSGAVGNACKVLADKGDAAVTSTAPLTYRATASTAAVAAATITPAPAGAPRARRAKKTAPAPATTPATPATPAAAPAPVGAGGSAAPVTGPVMRPNGMAYHPRQVAGMPDVTALRKLRGAGVAALMYGPPGTGKTSVI